MQHGNECDLYRTVKATELLTKFSNQSEHSVIFEALKATVVPKLLGSFKLTNKSNDVNLFIEGSIAEKIPNGMSSEICVARQNNGGMSCFDHNAVFSKVEQLPPVGDTPLETDLWYYLDAAGLAENEILTEYIENEPDRCDFQYNGQNCTVFLCFLLPTGVLLPPDFEAYRDNHSSGHWVIRRGNLDAFSAISCRIGGFSYALVEDLVNMGWIFQGLKLRAAAEPSDYTKTYDKDTWTLAVIIHIYFSCLSCEELVDDAAMLLTKLSSENYSGEACRSPIIAEILLRVLDDVAMCCDELEFAAICRFKLCCRSQF